MPQSDNLKSPTPNPPQPDNFQLCNFYGRDFFINHDVLTPRPETELLIDEVKSLAGLPILPGVAPRNRELPDRPILLDVGTGSGVIALTLAAELAPLNPTIFALDISEKALAVARKNATNFEQAVTFLRSDLLRDLPTAAKSPDLIVANLPYVDPDWPWLDKTALKSDPDLALYSPDHGLAHIKALLAQTETILTTPPKFLVLEADPSQHAELIKTAEKYRYKTTKSQGFTLVLFHS